MMSHLSILVATGLRRRGFLAMISRHDAPVFWAERKANKGRTPTPRYGPALVPRNGHGRVDMDPSFFASGPGRSGEHGATPRSCTVSSPLVAARVRLGRVAASQGP